MRSIGEMARASGLGVSALRFYDGAGVFGPARVDPRTGYRWYAPEQLAEARLIARLRRVGMPLAGISQVLGGGPDEARTALDAHLRRLEDGLADARRELSTVRALLEQREHPMTWDRPARLTLPAAELAAALDAVRFAVHPDDGALPSVAGVLFDGTEDGVLRLVATDRYRLAVSELRPVAADGPAAQVLVPAAFADALRGLLADGDGGDVELVVDGLLLTASADGRAVRGERIDLDFPDYRPMLRLTPTHRVEVEARALREEVAGAPVRTVRRDQDGADVAVTVLAVTPQGTLTAPGDGDEDGAGGVLRVRVDRDFLLEAVAAGASGQLVLELGGPVAPLAIRFPARTGTYSLLMPVAP